MGLLEDKGRAASRAVTCIANSFSDFGVLDYVASTKFAVSIACIRLGRKGMGRGVCSIMVLTLMVSRKVQGAQEQEYSLQLRSLSYDQWLLVTKCILW